MNNQLVNQQYKLTEGVENKFAGSYNRVGKVMNILSSLDPVPRMVLDNGCGTGFFANEVKKLYPQAKVYGIDISPKGISVGKKAFKTINLQVADSEKRLPFPSNHFDLVISGEHIEHLRDTDRYIREINRVLKKGGVLLLTTPNLGFWLSRLFLLFGKQPMFLEPSLEKTFPIFTFLGKTFPYDLEFPPAGHLRLYTLDMLKKFIKYYGFKVETVQGAKILSIPILKQIDYFFENFPSLAFGLIIKAKKL